MAVHSLRCPRAAFRLFLACSIYFGYALAITGSVYQLDSEYSGANFFQGWDFYTGGDPTGGFVTYYSQGSAQLTGMINSSDTSPIYIGSDYNSVIGSTQAAGRPSVRISTQRSWTHGLFIGDFNHAPGGICGTWPAFWTLGPNWPYNGEIDIMEGADLITNNAATLHSSTNCTIAGDSRTMTGSLSHNDCAYYPGYNVGCGVVDTRTTSYGAGFNANGGGIYAMQWTSDYIRVWFFPRGSIPTDITNKTPNPSSWGLPFANMQGSCMIDQHFQDHKIILNNAFCGEYAGAASVWNSTTSNSCATYTGYSTCNAFVAAVPGAFQNSYWSINSIRVYQLVDSSSNATSTSPPYIASNQPTQSSSSTTSSSTPVPTTSLCPTYNFTVVQSGNYNYEIECGVNIGGSDLGKPYPTYQYSSFEGCVAGCTYWNTYNSSNICGGVTYQVSSNACYWKRNVGSTPAQAGFNSARLIYYAYPQVTDDPRYQTTSSSSTSYVATSVTPVYYVPANATTTSTFSLITQTPTTNITDGVGLGGGATTDDASSTITDFSASTTANTTSRNHTYTGPYTRRNYTTSTTLLNSSTSTLFSTPATPALTTGSTVPLSSSTSSTTAPSQVPTTSGGQLSPGSSMSSSPQSSPTIGLITTASPSNPASTSAQISSSLLAMLSSTSTKSLSVALGTSSAVTQTQTSSMYPLTTTFPVSIYSSVYTSGSPSSTSGSSSVAPSSLASLPSSMISSSVFATSAPPPPSTAISGPSTSSSPTAIAPSPPLTSSSMPTSQSTSPSQPPLSTSNPPVFSTTQTPEINSSLSPNPALASTVSTPELPTPTTTSESLPGPTQIVSDDGASFSFAGCLAPRPDTPFANSFILVENSTSMSIERCVSDCSLDVYAGLYDTQCYCSSYTLPISSNSSDDFVEYPASACNTTCPGDPTQKCGGVVHASSSLARMRMEKRQITDTAGDVILLTLYNNTGTDDVGGSSSMSGTTPSPFAGALGGGLASTSTGMGGSFSQPLTTTTSPLSLSGLGSLTQNPISLTTSALTGSLPTTPPSAPTSPTSSPSLILSPTIISTTYTTICPFHPVICPTRTETCLTTTVTMLHCGCADMPAPDVPMTTTVVEGCAITPTPNTMGDNEHGEEEGSAEGVDNATEAQITTLTIPCLESISSLEAAVTAWASASTAAYAAAGANAQAYATAGATANANAAATAGGDTNAHPAVPYSLPTSFPMTFSPAAPTDRDTVTLSLVVATAKFNFSVPAVNATWTGDVKNITVMPVALSAMTSMIGSEGGSASASATAGAGRGANVAIKSDASASSRMEGLFCHAVVYASLVLAISAFTLLF